MKRIALLAALCLLTACGFHLKGLGGQRLQLDSIYVSADIQRYDEAQEQAYQALLDALQDSGVRIAESEAGSAYKLLVSEFSFISRETAVGGDSGNSREVEITDSYAIALFENGKSLGGRSISARSNISYSAGQYIGSSQEERNAHEQLARENAQSALRFIQAKAGKQP